MKKSILLLLAFGLAIASCKKDDNDNTPTELSKLVGTWQLSAEMDDGEAEVLSDCNKKSTLVLNSDKSMVTTVFDIEDGSSECKQEAKILGSYDVIIDGKITVTISLGNGSNDQVETFDYSITGKTLKIFTETGAQESSMSYTLQ